MDDLVAAGLQDVGHEALLFDFGAEVGGLVELADRHHAQEGSGVGRGLALGRDDHDRPGPDHAGAAEIGLGGEVAGNQLQSPELPPAPQGIYLVRIDVGDQDDLAGVHGCRVQERLEDAGQIVVPPADDDMV